MKRPYTELMIFGGSGFLGQNILKQAKNLGTKESNIVSVSRSETRIVDAQANLAQNDRIIFKSADVTNQEQVKSLVDYYKPRKVIIASAMKHIHLCEQNVEQAINVNVLGTKNIIRAIETLNGYSSDKTKVCFVSTDKACDPIGTYGYTKSLAEKLVIEANHRVVRYGNVLNSPMSIIPKLRALEPGSDIVLTHEDMTRFIMTANQAVELIMQALYPLPEGNIYVPELSSMKILDLMELFAEKKNLKLKVLNEFKNEKLHEKMVGDLEFAIASKFDVGRVSKSSTLLSTIYTISNTDKYYKDSIKEREAFVSDNRVISKQELKATLQELNLL